jgi:hypothetical protein
VARRWKYEKASARDAGLEESVAVAPKSVLHPDGGATRISPNEGAGYNLVLICRSCGNKWLIQQGLDGHFVPGFWLCPRRCDL